MRYDLKILWIDDVDTYYNETKEIIEMYVEDLGLVAEIKYVQKADEFLEKLRREQTGFKTYDIFFVDYSLSMDIVGSTIIKRLRDLEIDSDILFYSSEHEDDIRDTVTKDLGSFEGVYIANRINFVEKSNYLINKNSKRLSSLSNIRGLLTDQTSQNDFVIYSYVMHNYPKLKEEHQTEIKQMILKYMKGQKEEFSVKSESEINKIESNEAININKLFKLRDFLVPSELKHLIFQKMIKFNNETVFESTPLDDYKKDVTGLRNKLAHKKLVVCETQQHIICSDNIIQHNDRMCSRECDARSVDDNKISLDQWDNMRKQVVKYGKSFDALLEKIIEELPDKVLVT